MKRVAFAVPGDLDDADRRLCLRPPHDRGIAESSAGRSTSSTSATAFRAPTRRPRRRRATRLAAVPKDCPIVVDGLALGVLPEAAKESRDEHLADRAGASSAGAGNRSHAGRRAGLAGRASTTRLRPRAVSSSTVPRPHSFWSTITTCRPISSPLRFRHRSRRDGPGQQRWRGAACLGRCGGAAQGLRRADRGAGAADQSAVAADHCRRPDARRSDGDAARCRHHEAWARGPDRRLGALPADRLAALYVRVGRVRVGVAFRGLRHGLCRGARARPAGDRHHRRRDPRHGAAQRRRAGRAERRQGADPHAADADRQSQGARSGSRRAPARQAPRCRPGRNPPSCSPAQSRRWHELQRRLADVARALRSARPQRHGDRRGGRGASRGGRRSRSSILPAAPARRFARSRRTDHGAAELAARRQRSQPAGPRAAIVASRRPRDHHRRSISIAISKRRSMVRSIWSRLRRCSISFPTTGWSGSRSRSRRGGCRSMRR